MEAVHRIDAPATTAANPAAAQPLTADTLDLATHIGATSAERRVFAAMGARRNGAGTLPALRTATKAMTRAAGRHPSVRASAWLTILRDLVKKVAAAAAYCPWIDICFPGVQGRLVPDALGDPLRSTLEPDARERIDAWLGLHLFHALARGCVLSMTVVEDWETLLRTGLSRSNAPKVWRETAKQMPLTPEETSALLSGRNLNERLTEALKLTLAALAADVPEPDLSAEQVPRSAQAEIAGAAGTEPTAALKDSEDDDTVDDLEAYEETVGGEDKKPSLLRLLISRAFHSGYRGQFGVTGVYGELPAVNLQSVCRALVSTQATGTELDSTRVAVAELSLKLSLSPRRTLTLPLQPNDDIWLDLDRASICWNFDLIRDSRGGAGATRDMRTGSALIEVRISDRTILHLKGIRGSSTPSRLQDLLSIPLDELATRGWLKAYGEFLRAHGDANYPAYSVRFARSYRSTYLDRGHGAIVAAFVGLDFSTAPPGLLHYIYLPESHLVACQLDVDGYLGLHWSPRQSEGAH